MKRYIDSLTVIYALLCLSGIIILCIGLSDGFPEYTNTMITITGGLLATAGIIYLADKLISRHLVGKVLQKRKIYIEISGFLKWIMLELLIGVFAIGYWILTFYIIRSVSISR